jgi:cholinesterase
MPPGAFSSFFPQQSEDCLFVNVWTKPQVGEKKKAVLVWIYGGAFTIGDSNSWLTNGAAMANNQDIILVSLNYRVNVFGFPGAPSLSQANPGLLDQRLAVEWVRDNIAAFGGDPGRITIYGQSAGSMSVDDYAFAWKNDPIVNGFILSSGTALMGLGEPRLTGEAPARNWYTLSQELECGDATAGASTLKCIQGKPWKKVQTAMSAAGVGFGPISDNSTLFDDVYERAKRGDFIRKVSRTVTLGIILLRSFLTESPLAFARRQQPE